ncbi:PLxRFG domain-containing protein [Roseospira visakhapatnamensis]|uniref:Large polyvalent protein-associated domain-containing protein n=1 Tax=Roseospira visakhapatnamensis TaxID=390880 RepID=A0A7W6RD56_9PROT|nr:PLxRFG domain-containing protein [Roseospira visakhapatnamensis]MBB4266288.1 hypothetical protein [Roseospira visakhapatnamensis]
MPTETEYRMEAGRRGILPPRHQVYFDEAVRRGLIDPAPEPPEPDGPGVWAQAGNIARGVGERALDLAGGALTGVGAVVEDLGDAMERRVPLGTLANPGVPMTEEEIAAPNLGSAIQAIGRDAAAVDLGYEPRYTWDRLKNSEGVLDAAGTLIGFATEQGLVSVPDMIASIANPAGYIAARSGEIGAARAENQGRSGDVRARDVAEAAPAALTAALMERFGARGVLGLDDTVGRLADIPGAAAKAGAREGATEFAQEQIEYAGETVGTRKPWDVWDSLERGAAGAVAGGPFGGAVRAGTGVVQVLTHPEATPPGIGEQPDDGDPPAPPPRPPGPKPEPGGRVDVALDHETPVPPQPDGWGDVSPEEIARLRAGQRAAPVPGGRVTVRLNGETLAGTVESLDRRDAMVRLDDTGDLEPVPVAALEPARPPRDPGEAPAPTPPADELTQVLETERPVAEIVAEAEGRPAGRRIVTLPSGERLTGAVTPLDDGLLRIEAEDGAVLVLPEGAPGVSIARPDEGAAPAPPPLAEAIPVPTPLRPTVDRLVGAGMDPQVAADEVMERDALRDDTPLPWQEIADARDEARPETRPETQTGAEPPAFLADPPEAMRAEAMRAVGLPDTVADVHVEMASGHTFAGEVGRAGLDDQGRPWLEVRQETGVPLVVRPGLNAEVTARDWPAEARRSRNPREVVVNSADIGPFKTRRRWRDAAIRKIRAHVGTKVRHGELGDIRIPLMGVKHTVQGAQEELLLAATRLPDLIRTAQRMGPPQPDRRGRPEIKAVHHLQGSVRVDGAVRATHIVVRETADGRLFYDLALMGKDGSPATGAVRPPGAVGIQTSSKESLTQSIGAASSTLNPGLTDTPAETRRSETPPLVRSLLGDELGDLRGLKNRRKAMEDWYRTHLQGRTVEASDGRLVQFTQRGRNETRYRLSLQKALHIVAVEDVVKHGRYVGFVRNEKAKEKPRVRGYHQYEGLVRSGDTTLLVSVLVEEDQNGNLYYNLDTKPPSTLEPSQSSRAEEGFKAASDDPNVAGLREGSSPTNTISPAWDGVNLFVRPVGVVPGRSAAPLVYTPAVTGQAARLRRALRTRLREMGLGDVDVVIAEDIGGGARDGVYWRKLIAVALDRGEDAAHGTLNHEAIHALRKLGLLKGAEWTALKGAALSGDWIARHQVDARYPDLSFEGRLEEAVADEYRAWAEKQTPAPRHALARRAFNVIRRVLEQIRAAFQTVFQRPVTAEDVFRRIDAGALRGRGPVRDAGTRMDASAPPAPQPAPLVATLRGDELGVHGDDAQAWRRAADAWYRAHLQGRVVTASDGRPIRLTARGRKKTVHQLSPTTARYVPAIVTVLESGEYAGFSENRKPEIKPDVRGYHRYEGGVAIGSETTRVRLLVEERTDGTLYYDLYTEAPSSDPGLKRPGPKGASEDNASSRRIPPPEQSVNLLLLETHPATLSGAGGAETSRASGDEGRTLGYPPLGMVASPGAHPDSIAPTPSNRNENDRDTPAESRRPIGPFGPIFTEFRHDAKGAIARLIQEQSGEAVAALHHPEIGDIDLVWGKAGTGASDGYGLAKLVRFHPEVLDNLQGILSETKVVSRSPNRVRLASTHHTAVVSLQYFDREKTWLLTAYERRGSGAGTTMDTAELPGGGDTARSAATHPDSIAPTPSNRNENDRDTPAESRRPIGPFGPIFTEFRHDAKGAIARLIQEQSGEAVAALHHPEIGDIDLVWGKAGTGASDGYGLAKLVRFHPEVLDNLQGILSETKVVSRSPNRVRLASTHHMATVRLEWDGRAKTWLLTAYEKRRSGAGTTTDTAELPGGGDTARSAATHPDSIAPTPSNRNENDRDTPAESRRLGAALDRTLTALRDAHLPPPAERVRAATEDWIQGTRLSDPDGIKITQWLRGSFIFPNHVASGRPAFAPVFHQGMRFIETRETIARALGDHLRPYAEASPRDQRAVNAVLEMGRLKGRDFSGDPVITVVNDLDRALPNTRRALLKPGERITLSQDQARQYRAVRQAMRAALALYRTAYLTQQGFGRPGDPATPAAFHDMANRVDAGADPTTLARPDADGAFPDLRPETLREIADVLGILAQADREGYVPFSRYGDWGVAVIRPAARGREVVAFHKAEGRTEAARIARELRAAHAQDPGVRVLPPRKLPTEEAFRDDVLDLGAIAAFARKGGVDPETVQQVVEAAQGELSRAGFKKHFIDSKGTAGYTQDFARSLADYVVGLSGHLARRETMPEMTRAISRIPNTQPDLKRAAHAYRDYLFDPVEEWGRIRAFNFFAYLGGNPSSAALNTTQVVVFTGPVLSALSNPARAGRALTRAAALATRVVRLRANAKWIELDYDALPGHLRDPVMRLVEKGALVPQVSLEQQGVAAGRRASAARGAAEKVRNAGEAAAALFSATEQWNRLVTVLATLDLARDAKVRAAAQDMFKNDALFHERLRKTGQTAMVLAREGGDPVTGSVLDQDQKDRGQTVDGRSNSGQPTTVRTARGGTLRLASDGRYTYTPPATLPAPLKNGRPVTDHGAYTVRLPSGKTVDRRFSAEIGYLSAVDLAQWVTEQTQFILGKANRAPALRGVGALVFQFKAFTLHALQFQWRLATRYGPRGRAALGMNLIALLLLSGVMGLPFVEDLDEILRALGIAPDSRAWFTDTFGPTWGEVLRTGATRPLLGVDFGPRVGMGDILPIPFEQRPTQTLFDMWAPVLGVSGSTASNLVHAFNEASYGRWVNAAVTLAPYVGSAGAGNVSKALVRGQEGYRTRRGDLLLSEEEITPWDTATRALGFQSAHLAREIDILGSQHRLEKAGEAGRALRQRLVRAVVDRDREAERAALAEIEAWNTAHADRPWMQIRLTRPALRHMVLREMLGASDALTATAPRAARPEMRRIQETFPR